MDALQAKRVENVKQLLERYRELAKEDRPLGRYAVKRVDPIKAALERLQNSDS